jgi:Flp pilus assembly protein protease CpaA
MVHIADLLSFPISSDEIFMPENIFLICAAVFWMLIASIQDFKRREVENWWNFGMIIFVLAFRAFLSVERWNGMYFIWGLVGLAAGFLLSMGLYYLRLFAAGDAKLLMALMCILPMTLDWRINLALFAILFVFILLVGAIYGAVYSIVLVLMNCKSFAGEFVESFQKNIKVILILELGCLMALIGLLLLEIYLIASLIVLIMLVPFLIIYSKSIEESCMNELVDAKDLTIGDWLAKPVKLESGKTIKPNWEGLSEEELSIIRKTCKNRQILVKQGIPFVPVFLLAFLALLVLI